MEETQKTETGAEQPVLNKKHRQLAVGIYQGQARRISSERDACIAGGGVYAAGVHLPCGTDKRACFRRTRYGLLC